MPNVVHISDLQVPQVEQALADLRREVASMRTLQRTLSEAIIRVDADVQLILTALGIPADEST